eukprot:jgi/Tetstr1/459441/TSEL_004810.t1
MMDASPAQLAFFEPELARFLARGAWEYGSRATTSSPSTSRTGSTPYLGIAEADRDYFTVDIRGTIYRLGLPMGWSLSPNHFTTFTEVMVRHMRTSEPEPAPAASAPTPSTRYLRRTRWQGARILPYVDDFLLFVDTEAAALGVKARLQRVLDALGMKCHTEKGFWEPAQFGLHLGINIDSAAGLFNAPEAKQLLKLASQAQHLLNKATRTARRLPVWDLHALAGQAQYLFFWRFRPPVSSCGSSTSS